MKISHFYQITLLILAMASSSFISPVKLELPDNLPTITVKHDLSDLGEQLTKVGKETTEGVIKGVMEGASKAVTGGEFNKAAEEFFGGASTGITEAAAKAAENPTLGKNIGRVFGGISGQATGAFAKAGQDKSIGKNIEAGLTGASNQVTGAFAKAAANKNIGTDIESALTSASTQISGAAARAAENPELLENVTRVTSAGANIMGTGLQNFTNEAELKIKPQIERLSQGAIASVFNTRNAVQFGLPIALGIAVPLAGYYGSKVFWKVLEKRLTDQKPEIIEKEAHPKYGRMDRLKRWWAGYKTPQVIFDQQIKDHLIEIEEKTKNIRDHILNGDKQATYTNLLLYGPPGTGKTLFARVLADYTNMDFLPVSGARLLQSEIAFSEVIDMANRSKYGTIIFIDEADALFVDRDRLMASNAPDALSQYKALNHILGITGQKNNKFMIVAATNNPHVLDEAMDRRFPDTIEMPLPTASTRLELLKMYIKNQLFNEKNNSKEFVAAAHKLLTPTVIEEIVQKTDGFSHAKLEDMIKAMRDSARATKTGIITQKGVDNAVSRAITKHQNLEKNKAKKAKLFQQPEQQPTPSE